SWRWTAATCARCRSSRRHGTTPRSACSWKATTCPTRTTAGRTASRRSSTWWRRSAGASSRNSRSLALSLDLLQVVVLRRRLGPLAARAAEVLLRLFHRCGGGGFRAVGFDHHQARAFEQRLRVDPGLFRL